MSVVFLITRKENQKAYGSLIWREKGLETIAVSGPYGKGELPDGLYHAYRSDLLDKDSNSGFCDSMNQCWFQYLRPQFSTDRDQLGIHPDGGVSPGTLGCIGMVHSNTRDWYIAFKNIASDSYTVVEVKSNL